MEKGWERDLVIETSRLDHPGGDKVLVEIEACGVCHRDCIDRAGGFKFIRLPITPGHEAVGRVLAVGPEVGDWKEGDRVATMHRGFCGQCDACKSGQTSLCVTAASVLGLLIDGGYATHLIAPQSCFYRASSDMPAAHAAILHCTYGTAYRALSRSARLEKGQRVLVTGANGGVGFAAIQVARALGAEVIAVVRDDAHRDFLREAGASRVIVDPGTSFHKSLWGRVDAALECVGQPTFNASLRSLRIGGRMVVIGNVVPERAQLNLGYLVTSGVHISGSSGANRDDMARLLQLHARHPFAVHVDRTLPLDSADEAQRLVRAGGLRGRIVLAPGRT